MNISKHTKIVATIGPATETEETLTELVKAGMNIARFNTKHGTSEWHAERIQRIQNVSKRLKTPVGVLLDLQGPEIRINLPNENSFEMKSGDTAIFTSDEKRSDDNLIFIPQVVIKAMSEGDDLSLEDGICTFIVTKKGSDYFIAKATGEFTVGHRKTMNTPGVTIDLPSLIPTDQEKLEAVKHLEIEYVALSFVRNAKDIEILRKELKKHGMNSDVMAKIENQSSLDNLDEIIAASDAIMVARGDLGVEVPFEELIYWQKTIINRSRAAGKPVITATQMLKSMVSSPLPTRAEVSDVAHAIYDGTDAVMLSEESTIGEYPVKAVETQAIISEFNEPHTDTAFTDFDLTTPAEYLTSAVMHILEHDPEAFDTIVVLTETGRTARLMSRLRPQTMIHAITRKPFTADKMALYYGVVPHVVEFDIKQMESVEYISSKLKQEKIVKPGQQALLVHGSHWGVPNKIGSLSIVTIK